MSSPDPITQLRAAKPAASPELRERVRAIAARTPEPRRPSFPARFSLRRAVLVAAPAALALALGAAGVIGLTRSGEGERTVSPPLAREKAGTVTTGAVTRALAPGGVAATADHAATLPPTAGRLQRYDAELRLRVNDLDALSAATQKAMRIARSLGGYVASAAYDAPETGPGSAMLVLRVPTTRVQSAIVQLSGLGTILGQRIGIEDLQGQADTLADRITVLQGEIASLRRQLETPDLTDDARAQLELRLAQARRELAEVRAALEQTRTEGTLATVSVSLTTEQTARLQEQGRVERALDRALDALAWEASAALIALSVAGPLLLLAGGAWKLVAVRRRRAEERLLDRSE